MDIIEIGDYTYFIDVNLISNGLTPVQIIQTLNPEYTQAYISLIERIRRRNRLLASTTIPAEGVGPQANGGG